MRYEYVVNVYIFNSDFTALLFVLRTKPPYVGQWLPPGGHVTAKENPLGCARREVKELTDMDIQLLDFKPGYPIVLDNNTVRMPSPIHVQVDAIDKDHKHVNFVFLGQVSDGKDDIVKDHQERVQWITLTELKDCKMPKNVRDLATYLFHYKQED